MSFFGDVVKVFKKGAKKVKKGVKEAVRVAQPLVPLIARIPGAGPAIAGGITVAGAFVGEEDRNRRKKGMPPRAGRPIVTRRSFAALRRITTAAAARAAGPVAGAAVATRISGRRVTPAAIRTLPTPTGGAAPMRLVPASRRPAIATQPAGFQFQVPETFRDPVGSLRRALPFTTTPSAGVPATRGFGEIVPLTPTTDKAGRPVVVQPKMEQRVRCPPGYLAVEINGARACMLAPVAIAAGLARRRKKPIISVRDSNAIRRAERARGRLKRATEGAGFVVRMKSTSRRTKRG